MKYKAISNPTWVHKKTGRRVSIYGSAPIPESDYEVQHIPSVEITDNSGRVTYSNYFYGEILKTVEDAIKVVKKLNA